MFPLIQVAVDRLSRGCFATAGDPQHARCAVGPATAGYPEFLLIGGQRPIECNTLLSLQDHMFDQLVRFLTGADDALQSGHRNDAAFALAVLLIEVARSDDRVEAREQSLIARALARRFGLDRSEVTSLMEAAKEGAIKATDLHHFTQVVVSNFNEEERIGVIEMLWDVAYSDSVLTGDEDALIRRVAGLIYVSDWERGEAKRRVTQRLQDNRRQ